MTPISTFKLKAQHFLQNFPSLLGKKKELIGVDISASGIKMVELKHAGNNVQLERYLIEPIGKDLINEGHIQDLNLCAEALSKALDKFDSPHRQIALALPTSMAIYKRMSLPNEIQAGEELEFLVEQEAAQFVPFALDEVNLDYQMVQSADKTSDQDLVICAAKKEKVEERQALAQMAGANLKILDVESFSLFNALEKQLFHHTMLRPQDTYAIFDLGATKLHCLIMRNKQQIYYRELAFGGQQLTREIQRRYNYRFEEAEAYKRSMALPDGYEAELLLPFVDSLAQEIQRTLQYFYSAANIGSQRVDQIILSGGSSLLAGLDEAVSLRTQIPTLIANPFQNMTPASAVPLKKLIQDAPCLLVACGLALRKFN